MTTTNTVTVNGCLVTWTDAHGHSREVWAVSVKAAARVARRITKRLASR